MNKLTLKQVKQLVLKQIEPSDARMLRKDEDFKDAETIYDLGAAIECAGVSDNEGFGDALEFLLSFFIEED